MIFAGRRSDILENYSYVWVKCRSCVENCSILAYEIGLSGVKLGIVGRLLRFDRLYAASDACPIGMFGLFPGSEARYARALNAGRRPDEENFE